MTPGSATVSALGVDSFGNVTATSGAQRIPAAANGMGTKSGPRLRQTVASNRSTGGW